MELNDFYVSCGYIIGIGGIGMVTLFILGLIKERKDNKK